MAISYVFNPFTGNLDAIDTATPSSSSSVQNYIVNGAFDYWQRAFGINNILAGATTYTADQWYVKNNEDVVVSAQPVGGSVDGSRYAYRIETLVPGGTTGDFEIWQVIEAKAAANFINQDATFSVNIVALGNVTQVGIQFFYDAIEIKPTTSIGSEQLFTITGTPTVYTITQAIGSVIGAGTDGVIGIRIRPTAVSSGGIFDQSNGLRLEQAILTVGSSAVPFQRLGLPEEELAACQRFYEKSYEPYVNLTTNTLVGIDALFAEATDSPLIDCKYKVTKRTAPTFTVYNPISGATSSARGITGNNNVSASTAFSVSSQSSLVVAVISVTDFYGVQWTADSSI